ncbi:discoidin domain-containing protein [Kribbella albertanoniae]|uniref:Coagulation factor 5/8 type domain protein n=1 Tax=Kribbella albertanoniae TaxID=1266829 RepID=A0A4V2XQK2_9ACTN|nr:discoidin domain-containing protein [Kribbella albertanoniae]TDC25925.1 coagulation factor 5/8 type domain protein [Kribbella albertanoniae]
MKLLPALRARRRRRRPAAVLIAVALVAFGNLVVSAVPAQAATLLSQGKPATASTSEGAGTPASAAVDGDANTRWSSAWADNQWLQVDLGATATIEQVVLQWEAAYATGYRIETSANGQQWNPIYSTSTGPGGTETLNINGSGRYVRIFATTRANGYGVSLFEFRVFGTPGNTGPSQGTVRIAGSQGNWQLLVNDNPWVVKGLTWGPPPTEAAQRLPELKAIGVNTVRTWGTDASSKTLFDAAAANGMRVVAGYWLQPGGGPGSGGCANYVTDTDYKTTMLAEIRRWTTEYKDNPGVLIWNVGNESVLGLQNCYSGAELEQQRIAYATFVNDAAKAIHAIDPNHPVTSTDAWTGAWPYYKQYSPDLDLLAVNSYGHVCQVKQDWINGGYNKPYILTEGGPAGEWEVPNDANGVPDQPTDLQKRDGYLQAWNCITGHAGVALGATLFHYGSENDFGAVWFNITPGNEKSLAWYAIRQAFGGPGGGNTPPVITNMTLSRTTDVPAGGTISVNVAVTDPDGDVLSHDFKVNGKYIDGSGALVGTPSSGSGPFTVTVPQRLGVWKLYDYVRDGRGHVSIETRSFRVVAPPVEGTNIARGKPTTASSYQQTGNGAPYPPSNVTDGNNTTRWASDWADPQWVQVDLGQVTSFDRIQLIWEGAFAREYRVEVSDDGNAWRALYSTAAGNGDVDDITTGGTGRYVRLTGTQRGTGWGYSLYEFGIYKR